MFDCWIRAWDRVTNPWVYISGVQMQQLMEGLLYQLTSHLAKTFDNGY